MGELFNLDYFDNIFEDRDEAYIELLDTLVDSLEEFARDYRTAVTSRDAKTLGFVRHRAVTLVENLKLDRLKALNEESKAMVETGTEADLEANVQAVEALITQIADGLRSVRASCIV